MGRRWWLLWRVSVPIIGHRSYFFLGGGEIHVSEWITFSVVKASFELHPFLIFFNIDPTLSLVPPAATLGAFVLGTALGWTSPALPKIQESECGDECDVSNISDADASWIGALMPVGAMLSGPVVGKC